jgi:HSP20 family protein
MFSLMEPRSFYRDVFDFRRGFDEIFYRLMGETPAVGESKMLPVGFVPAVEAWTDPEAKKYHLRVALPGVDAKDVKIEAQGDILKIAGERKTTETKKEADFFHREFTYGSFERHLTLPEGVEAEKLTAEFNNGVLELTAPIAAAALPHKVEIKPVLKKAA